MLDKTCEKNSVVDTNRNHDAPFMGSQWCLHCGLLLLSKALSELRKDLPEQIGQVAVQWISQLLSGAVNLEQTKLLSIHDLEILLGPLPLRSPVH